MAAPLLSVHIYLRILNLFLKTDERTTPVSLYYLYLFLRPSSQHAPPHNSPHNSCIAAALTTH